MNNPIEFVFFDIGGTLGQRDPTTGKLLVFPTTVALMTSVRDVLGLRMGVITTLGTLSNSDGKKLLVEAGLADFLTPEGFVSEHDVGDIAKPRREIYEFAAQKVGVPIANCLFIGESLIEIIGALNAGMQAVLKPSP